ncbi:ras GEF [Piromyces finnis]|uniref:Ras GEF n=1 Tax=Piromyces finnis TaxID=1754191 RepID=A0A1Y1V3G7_9FUNG|nr:ras GEF [Piromyces finnis]|eukprot:ORX46365.1 ras GEF [Piromyces finnis]
MDEINNEIKSKEMEPTNTMSKAKDSSLSILTGLPLQKQNSYTKSLTKGMGDDINGNKNLITSRQYMTSVDDLVNHRRSLYTCYSNRAITMYNVNTNLKDYTGSTPNMFTLNKSIRTQKMTRSCSGEDKSLTCNVSASLQTISNNSVSSPKIKSFKDKIFVFKKNKSSQQWLDDFLKKNIVDEKPVIEDPTIIDSNANLCTLLQLKEYDSNHDFPEIYNNIMRTGENFIYSLDHEPFWRTQPKIFPECDVNDIQTLSRELNIYKDELDMRIDGIKYKEIEGKAIPYEGSLEAVMDSLIFPTAQETQLTDAFLVSYRFYITPLDLLKFIISWFNVKLPQNPTKDQEFFYDENKKNIQQRCLKLLNFWIRLHWHDFTSSAVMGLLNKFMNQIGDLINNTNLYGEYTKLDTVLRKQKLTLFTKQYTFINENSSNPTKSKFSIPNDNKKPWALIMTSQEFSSQLLLHEKQLFKDIEPDYYIYLLEGTKLMDENFGKFTLYKPIRIVLSYISWFYQLSQYTITVIGEQLTIKKKLFALKKFIKIAKACLVNKNYNSAAAIYFSLKNQLFVRQHVLWESLPNDLIESMEELDNIFSNSYNYHYEIQQLELQPYPDDNVII